jgi:predicted house-cleaning noncanonical NTP pyrophosphatase (MazG superfamily)
VQLEKALEENSKKCVVDIKNKKSLRKKLKRKLQEQEMEQFRKEEKAIRKGRTMPEPQE